jgi:hypothetical protein
MRDVLVQAASIALGELGDASSEDVDEVVMPSAVWVEHVSVGVEFLTDDSVDGPR